MWVVAIGGLRHLIIIIVITCIFLTCSNNQSIIIIRMQAIIINCGRWKGPIHGFTKIDSQLVSLVKRYTRTLLGLPFRTRGSCERTSGSINSIPPVCDSLFAYMSQSTSLFATYFRITCVFTSMVVSSSDVHVPYPFQYNLGTTWMIWTVSCISLQGFLAFASEGCMQNPLSKVAGYQFGLDHDLDNLYYN